MINSIALYITFIVILRIKFDKSVKISSINLKICGLTLHQDIYAFLMDPLRKEVIGSTLEGAVRAVQEPTAPQLSGLRLHLYTECEKKSRPVLNVFI